MASITPAIECKRAREYKVISDVRLTLVEGNFGEAPHLSGHVPTFSVAGMSAWVVDLGGTWWRPSQSCNTLIEINHHIVQYIISFLHTIHLSTPCTWESISDHLLPYFNLLNFRAYFTIRFWNYLLTQFSCHSYKGLAAYYLRF